MHNGKAEQMPAQDYENTQKEYLVQGEILEWVKYELKEKLVSYAKRV